MLDADALTQPRAAAAGLRVFNRIADRWALSSAERQALLGGVSSISQSGPTSLTAETVLRLSYLFRIFGTLQILLSDSARADAWIREPNSAPLFGGRTALQLILSGQLKDLQDVADYLETHVVGDYS